LAFYVGDCYLKKFSPKVPVSKTFFTLNPLAAEIDEEKENNTRSFNYILEMLSMTH
jgi:hypothetical protein